MSEFSTDWSLATVDLLSKNVSQIDEASAARWRGEKSVSAVMVFSPGRNVSAHHGVTD